MKTNVLCLLCLLFAGCSSISSRNPDPQAGATTSTYHHETVTEFNDGETKFLQLVPDKNP